MVPSPKKDIDLLESVQRFATKICTKSWSTRPYEERFHSLNLDSLSKRRAFLKLCYLCKLVHRLSVSYNLPINFCLYSTCFNHNLTLEVPFSHSNSYFFVMQPWYEIHYLIILYLLVFTHLNRMYLLICHSCLILICLLYHLIFYYLGAV